MQVQETIAQRRYLVEFNDEQEILTGDPASVMAQIDRLVAHYGQRPTSVSEILTAPAPVTAVTVSRPVILAQPTAQAAPSVVRDGQAVDIEGQLRSWADLKLARDAGFAPAEPLYVRGTRVIELGVDNARLSRLAHDQTPQTGESCLAVAERVSREERVDYTADVRRLVMGENGRLGFTMNDGKRVDVGVTLNGWKSLLSQSEATPRGAASYLAELPAHMRARDVNYWFAKSDRTIKLRTRKTSDGDRAIYAVVSPQYACIDADLIAKIVARVVPHDARGMVAYDGIARASTRSGIRTSRRRSSSAGEFFKAGITIESDDSGGGSLRAKAKVWQNLCLNLINIDEATKPLLKAIHKGDPNAIGLALARAFKQGADSLASFRKAWNYASEQNPIEQIQATGLPFPGAVRDGMRAIFAGIVEHSGVVAGKPSEIADKLLAQWDADASAAAGPTRAAVANALTRYAHTELAESVAAGRHRRVCRSARSRLATAASLPARRAEGEGSRTSLSVRASGQPLAPCARCLSDSLGPRVHESTKKGAPTCEFHSVTSKRVKG